MRLLQPVKISGWGLNGKVAKMEVNGADGGAGIVFNRSIKAAVENAQVIGNCTCLKSGKGMVMMVEHFLAACYGIGISDLMVDIEGGMLPFGEGSAQPFVRAFLRAGLVNTKSQETVKLRSPIGVKDGKGFILLVPGEKLRIHCLIDYPHLGRQFFSGFITRKFFCEEIAPARTFGRPPRHLKERLGFGLKRVRGWVFPKRLRFNNEPCRHKVLDLLGDLALLGRPLQGEIFAFNPSHSLNLILVRRLKEMGA
ncbi:MAG: UDP-3-O-acyl-N-acetylglucosamine deacetylase [candidate division WOR-3 bacterium]